MYEQVRIIDVRYVTESVKRTHHTAFGEDVEQDVLLDFEGGDALKGGFLHGAPAVRVCANQHVQTIAEVGQHLGHLVHVVHILRRAVARESEVLAPPPRPLMEEGPVAQGCSPRYDVITSCTAHTRM